MAPTDDIARQIAEHQAKIERLEGVRDLLGDQETDARKAPLERALAALRGEAITFIGHAEVGGDYVQGDKLDIRVEAGAYQGGPVPAEQIPAVYRSVLAARTGDVPLGGVDIKAADMTVERQSLTLQGVYVGLDTTTRVGVEGSEQDRLGRDSRPLSAIEAVAGHPSLVLLGDPGSGKTTFVHRLSHALATREGLPGWPPDLGERIPVLVVLRDFVLWLQQQERAGEKASPRLLWDYISHDLAERNLAFAEERLQGELERHRIICFLDGLDEVPPAHTDQVRDAVKAFRNRHADNRFVVTCRVLAYQQPQWRLPKGFPDFELAAFDGDKIEQFIEAWYGEVARRWNRPEAQTRKLAAKLKAAVARPVCSHPPFPEHHETQIAARAWRGRGTARQGSGLRSTRQTRCCADSVTRAARKSACSREVIIWMLKR
jgi:hypothetical protein